MNSKIFSGIPWEEGLRVVAIAIDPYRSMVHVGLKGLG